MTDSSDEPDPPARKSYELRELRELRELHTGAAASFLGDVREVSQPSRPSRLRVSKVTKVEDPPFSLNQGDKTFVQESRHTINFVNFARRSVRGTLRGRNHLGEIQVEPEPPIC
jgi:hypothetical protein